MFIPKASQESDLDACVSACNSMIVNNLIVLIVDHLRLLNSHTLAKTKCRFLRCFGYNYARILQWGLLLAAGPLAAHSHPSPGHWALSADFLYVLPSIDNTYFVTVSPEAPAGLPVVGGVKENNDFDFSPGFRVGGIYGFCECEREFQVYYSRLNATTTTTVSGDFLTPSIGVFALAAVGFPGTAHSSIDLLYQRVDGFFSQEAFNYCGFDFAVLGGIEYAYMRLDETYVYSNLTPLGSFSEICKSWGIGPQLGFECDYNLCSFSFCECPGLLSLVGFTSASILASKTQVEGNVIVGVDELFVDENASWRLIPTWHARLGLNYSSNVSCLGVSLEVGYEFDMYFRAVRRFVIPIGAGLAGPEYDNVDLQGLYICAAFTF